MDLEESTNKLTAWWLDMAPARQEELLTVPLPPLPWLDESLAGAGLDAADIQGFLDGKRREPEHTHDAGVNPRPV